MYGEEEFFAAAPDDERIDVARPDLGGHQLQRLAGATMLLAVVGAVGGAIVLTSVPSVAGERRGGATRGSAAMGSRAPARPRAGGGLATANVARVRIAGERPATRTGGAPKLAGGAHHTVAHRRALAIARAPRKAATEVAAPATSVVAVVSAPAGTPAPSASAGDLTAAAAVRAPRGQVEFGFER